MNFANLSYEQTSDQSLLTVISGRLGDLGVGVNKVHELSWYGELLCQL